LTEAVEEYRKIETMAAVAADEPRFVFTVGIRIGLTLSEQGDSKAALSEYQKAVGLLQRQQNEGENQDFIALYHLSTSFELSKMGDAEGAVNHFQKAIDIYKCDSSEIDILFGFYIGAGRLFFAEAQFQEAAEMYVSALEFFQQQKTIDSNIIAVFRYNIACMLFAQDDLEGAEREFRKAQAIKGSAYDEMPAWEDLRLGMEQLGKLIETAKEFRRARIVRASNECRPLPVGGDIRECLREVLFLEVKTFSTLRRSRCAFP
jgi:tetratricopeptide (TPR) repeat protein